MALTKKQRESVDRYKKSQPKIYGRDGMNKEAKVSWWIEKDFASRAKEEESRMRNSMFGQTTEARFD